VNGDWLHGEAIGAARRTPGVRHSGKRR
jgi:hypothetical protein